LYGIEYNGLTQTFTVVSLLDSSDTIFYRGVFIANLTAGTATGGGINPTPPPEPVSLALLGIGLGAMRRRKMA